MTVLVFTSEEKKYLVKEPLNWHAKDDAPEDIKRSIERKLDILNVNRNKFNEK